MVIQYVENLPQNDGIIYYLKQNDLGPFTKYKIEDGTLKVLTIFKSKYFEIEFPKTDRNNIDQLYYNTQCTQRLKLRQ